MSRAWNYMKKLWQGENKVSDLRDKEEQGCFAKMPQDGHHGDRHSGKVTKRIADKYSSWIPEEKIKI